MSLSDHDADVYVSKDKIRGWACSSSDFIERLEERAKAYVAVTAPTVFLLQRLVIGAGPADNLGAQAYVAYELEQPHDDAPHPDSTG